MQCNPLTYKPEGVISNKVIISVHEDLAQAFSCRVCFIKWQSCLPSIFLYYDIKCAVRMWASQVACLIRIKISSLKVVDLLKRFVVRLIFASAYNIVWCCICFNE
jgi:hypothetical protein